MTSRRTRIGAHGRKEYIGYRKICMHAGRLDGSYYIEEGRTSMSLEQVTRVGKHVGLWIITLLG